MGLVEYSSLVDVLGAAQKKGNPILFTLSTGHQVSLTLQAVGTDWVSGYPPGKYGPGHIIRLASVSFFSGCDPDSLGLLRPGGFRRAPLQALLASCATGGDAVVVHTTQQARRGTIMSAGPDWMRFQRMGGGEDVVPYACIEWVEVGSDV